MKNKIFKKLLFYLKRVYKKIVYSREINAIFNKNPNAASLSTLQKINFDYYENDIFYEQTRIRLCAHIVDKDLTILPKRSMYRQFACELAENLKNYRGPEIVSIKSARNILKEYEERYGIS